MQVLAPTLHPPCVHFLPQQKTPLPTSSKKLFFFFSRSVLKVNEKELSQTQEFIVSSYQLKPKNTNWVWTYAFKSDTWLSDLTVTVFWRSISAINNALKFSSLRLTLTKIGQPTKLFRNLHTPRWSTVTCVTIMAFSRPIVVKDCQTPCCNGLINPLNRNLAKPSWLSLNFESRQNNSRHDEWEMGLQHFRLLYGGSLWNNRPTIRWPMKAKTRRTPTAASLQLMMWVLNILLHQNLMDSTLAVPGSLPQQQSLPHSLLPASITVLYQVSPNPASITIYALRPQCWIMASSNRREDVDDNKEDAGALDISPETPPVFWILSQYFRQNGPQRMFEGLGWLIEQVNCSICFRWNNNTVAHYKTIEHRLHTIYPSTVRLSEPFTKCFAEVLLTTHAVEEWESWTFPAHSRCHTPPPECLSSIT